jgi:hypothetical protein
VTKAARRWCSQRGVVGVLSLCSGSRPLLAHECSRTTATTSSSSPGGVATVFPHRGGAPRLLFGFAQHLPDAARRGTARARAFLSLTPLIGSWPWRGAPRDEVPGLLSVTTAPTRGASSSSPSFSLSSPLLFPLFSSDLCRRKRGKPQGDSCVRGGGDLGIL